MKQGKRLALFVMDEEDKVWSVLNTAFSGDRDKGLEELKTKQRHWQVTVFPNAKFKIEPQP